MSTKSTHVWTAEYFFLEDLVNAQHLSDFHKSMYTGVAFTLDMTGLLPHKTITLSKDFFKSYLPLVLSRDTAQSPAPTHSMKRSAPEQETLCACTVCLHTDFPGYSLPG